MASLVLKFNLISFSNRMEGGSYVLCMHPCLCIIISRRQIGSSRSACLASASASGSVSSRSLRLRLLVLLPKYLRQHPTVCRRRAGPARCPIYMADRSCFAAALLALRASCSLVEPDIYALSPCSPSCFLSCLCSASPSCFLSCLLHARSARVHCVHCVHCERGPQRSASPS